MYFVVRVHSLSIVLILLLVLSLRMNYYGAPPSLDIRVCCMACIIIMNKDSVHIQWMHNETQNTQVIPFVEESGI